MENIKNIKSKKNILLMLGGILLVALDIVGFFVFGKKTDASRFKSEYESLNGTVREKDKQAIRSIEVSKDNPFVYQTATEIVERIKNNETFAVYFGFSDCPWCRSVVPTLIEVSKDLNIGTIYYVDVKELRDVKEINDEGEIIISKEPGEGYDELLQELGTVLKDYTLKDKDGNDVETGEKRIFAPNLVVVRHGDAVALETGISRMQDNAYMELTDEMKKETYDTFKNALQKLNDEGGVCSNDTGC